MDANILNSVSSNVSTTYTKPAEAKESTKDTQEVTKTEEKAGKFSEEAAVYEKSSDDTAVKSEKYSKGDRTALVQQLKADQEKMMNNLLEIVQIFDNLYLLYEPLHISLNCCSNQKQFGIGISCIY